MSRETGISATNATSSGFGSTGTARRRPHLSGGVRRCSPRETSPRSARQVTICPSSSRTWLLSAGAAVANWRRSAGRLQSEVQTRRPGKFSHRRIDCRFLNAPVADHESTAVRRLDSERRQRGDPDPCTPGVLSDRGVVNPRGRAQRQGLHGPGRDGVRPHRSLHAGLHPRPAASLCPLLPADDSWHCDLSETGQLDSDHQESARVGARLDPALDHGRSRHCRDVLPAHAELAARDARRGLHQDGPRQGVERTACGLSPRTAQLVDTHRHAIWHRPCPA